MQRLLIAQAEPGEAVIVVALSMSIFYIISKVSGVCWSFELDFTKRICRAKENAGKILGRMRHSRDTQEVAHEILTDRCRCMINGD